jgi:hypothetical protein
MKKLLSLAELAPLAIISLPLLLVVLTFFK